MTALTSQGPRTPLIHEKVEQWAVLTPSAIAVRCADQTLSYDQLNKEAARVAAYLNANGIGRGDLVGICFQPSIATVVCLLGILKSGAAYVPLDKANPPARLALMLSQLANLKLVFASSETEEQLRGTDVNVMEIDGLRERLKSVDLIPFSHQASANDLCYTVFTSGTTGTPKAVAITHGSWANLAQWLVSEYGLGPDANNLLVSAFGFDISQRSLVTPLYSGATLSILPGAIFDPYEAADTIAQHQIQTLHLAPSSLYLILAAGGASKQLDSLRYLFIGGEALSTRRVMAWAQNEGRQCNFIHQYGVAECTDVATSYRMTHFDSYLEHGIPMGEPVGNCCVEILDDDGHPVAPGETGQIVIGGTGVGPGYLNNPALQAERFKSVIIEGQLQPAYFTGDYARRLEDGRVICIGRKDSQVKVRGMLVNLADVENGLRSVLASCEEVIVLAVNDQAANDAVLTAFVATQGQQPNTREMGLALSRVLPRYMHPQKYVHVHEFPLTQNGKVDRNALLASIERRA
jgi:D-alanine--poly(phosphoribitol) ligase subunit 1